MVFERKELRGELGVGSTRKRNTILTLTFCLLVVAAGFVAARFVAWQHEGWAGFWYVPALPSEFQRRIVMFKRGAVSSIFFFPSMPGRRR